MLREMLLLAWFVAAATDADHHIAPPSVHMCDTSGTVSWAREGSSGGHDWVAYYAGPMYRVRYCPSHETFNLTLHYLTYNSTIGRWMASDELELIDHAAKGRLQCERAALTRRVFLSRERVLNATCALDASCLLFRLNRYAPVSSVDDHAEYVLAANGQECAAPVVLSVRTCATRKCVNSEHVVTSLSGVDNACGFGCQVNYTCERGYWGRGVSERCGTDGEFPPGECPVVCGEGDGGEEAGQGGGSGAVRRHAWVGFIGVCVAFAMNDVGGFATG